MKNKFLTALVAGALLLPGLYLRADDTGNPTADLKDLVNRISASLKDGQHTEAEQADHLKEFDALLVKYKGQTNDAVAQIAFMQAKLYETVFKNDDKAIALLEQIKVNYPETQFAKHADEGIADIKAGAEARKVQKVAAADAGGPANSFVVGEMFSDFDVKDLDDKPLSVAAYKGKVVMVDFWATWCGPCVGEVPNVAKVYKDYHDKGFEIIGVSLDREGDKDKVLSFTKQHDMGWQQFFDGGGWQNQLAKKYGINSIPATVLLDGTGKIIAKNVRGPGLAPAVAKALNVKYEAGPDDSLEGTLTDNSDFPDFKATDLDGKPMSLATYKGKLVMVDFWATWCPPCRAEAPNIAKTYAKYHDKGFEIIGISLDRPDSKDKLVTFTKENNMTWGQYYDGADGPGKIAQKYGVHSIPTAFLVGANGKIIAQGDELRGEGLEPAIKKALGGN